MTIDAELNRKFPLAIDLKQNIASLLEQGTKAGELDTQLTQHTLEVNVPEAQPDSKLCS